MIDSLPSDLMIMVFLKLPAKTLLRCLAVSTKWKTLIQGQTFIDAHLSRQRGDLILVRTCPEGSEKEIYSIHCDDETFSQYANYEFPLPLLETCYRVVGSCNGVICITTDQFTIRHDTYLWNPIIKKCVKLPRPRVTYCSHGGFDHELGFGLDPTTNDYKVVRIVYLRDVDDAPLEVDIYSLSSKSWRNVSHLALGLGFRIFQRYSTGEREHQVYLNGVLHWVGYQKNEEPTHCVIIAFHLGDEVFRCFEPPTIAVSVMQSYHALKPAVIQNTFSLVQHTKGRCSIWMMKNYGDTSSWVKQKDINLTGIVDRVIGFRKKGELLIEIHGGLYSFDPEGKELKVVDEYGASILKYVRERYTQWFYSGGRIHIRSHVYNYFDPEVAPKELGIQSKTEDFFEYTFHSESYTESLVLIGMTSSVELGQDESQEKESRTHT